MPRALPAAVFGTSECVPGAFWVHQSGSVTAKCNIQVEGLSEAELNVFRATWSDYESPIAPLPPPSSNLLDAAAVVFPTLPFAATLENATCPACRLLKQGLPLSAAHTLKWGECQAAPIPPKPMSAPLPSEDEPD